MAMKIEWQKPAIDAAIAIGGGTLVKTFVINKFAMISGLFAKLPMNLMGIDVQLLVAGAVVLIVVKNYIMK